MSDQPETRYQRIAREQAARQASWAKHRAAVVKAEQARIRRNAKRRKPVAETSDHDTSMNG